MIARANPEWITNIRIDELRAIEQQLDGDTERMMMFLRAFAGAATGCMSEIEFRCCMMAGKVTVNIMKGN